VRLRAHVHGHFRGHLLHLRTVRPGKSGISAKFVLWPHPADLSSAVPGSKLTLVYSGAAMSSTINIHEAKTHLSRIVDDVAAGAEVIIAKAGKPMARLSPIAPAVRPKRFGILKGKISVADDFNAPLSDEDMAAFEGR
jgi:prevent-host-death family protein